MVVLADVAEIREPVADCGKLPVYECDNARFGRVDQRVAETKITMNDDGLVLFGDVVG